MQSGDRWRRTVELEGSRLALVGAIYKRLTTELIGLPTLLTSVECEWRILFDFCSSAHANCDTPTFAPLAMLQRDVGHLFFQFLINEEFL